MKNLLMRILMAFVGIAIVAGAAYLYTKFQFNTVIVDNPTDAEISVKIDSGEEFKIAAKASVKQKIADGEHEVFVNGESVGKFDKKYSIDAALSYFGKSAILTSRYCACFSMSGSIVSPYCAIFFAVAATSCSP